ncbi:MAG: DUF1553 domain-containing protein [Planctomycetia bacterium]|nr:DUF1553 domain-containing protein [Planctomycetia bacterium]
MVRSCNKRRFQAGCLAVLLGGLLLGRHHFAPAVEPLPQTVEFNRDIRPILSDTCFHCHGPDKAKRKANLRLDTEEGARADLGGYHALTPGNPAKSELLQRLLANDDEGRMPPKELGRPLTERQIQLVRRWIEQGAKWEKHWAFLPPQRRVPPSGGVWSRNPIDGFIRARLEHDGLQPSSEADRTTLVRRVTLDLTGLPPTPAEVDAALQDASPDWYETVVARLLASPRYGERMAVRWLDAARYADSNGYQDDGERYMWRWRDWVIDAFNRNMPFDQFTVEQIAGDLLPNATLEQKIATGFNRNHRINAEGGIIPEEYAVEYVADRLETTATVWLGLTLTCTRCHDHKYDPIKQSEFYQLFAYFNNVPESGRGFKYGNSPPYMKAPTPDQQAQLQAADAKVAQAEARFRKLGDAIAQAQGEWEKKLTAQMPFTPEQRKALDWTVVRELLAHYPLDGNAINRAGGDRPASPGTEFRDGQASFIDGKLHQAADFDGRRFIDAGDTADFGFDDRFTIAAWVYPQGERGGTIVSRMADGARAKGYNLALVNGKVQFNLVVRWLDDALRVESENKLAPNRWHHVLASYDGKKAASGVRIAIDGQPAKLHVHLDALNQTFQIKEPLRIGAGGGKEGRFHGRIDDLRIYRDVLTAAEARIVAQPTAIADILAIPSPQRSEADAHKLRGCFLELHAPAAMRQARNDWLNAQKSRERLLERFPDTMVMDELPTPRATFVLIRGEYDKRGEKVTAGVPAVLQPLPSGVPNNRLGFARWLVDPKNPLTARVTVNRFWQHYFGTGLVKTVDDFGSQGEWPSHPELLDWLATEFVRTGWDVKRLQELIVTSATYRQSSKVTKALLEKDPENRLLARGPRLRLSAETIRDQALAAGGLLVERVGGPSVKPYQPAGLWKELSGGKDYEPDRGQKLYRRSLYTFWKRTVTPPGMLTFDASMRETCVVRETRTNTPLQALNLMNDVTYVEASRVLAQRIMTEAGPTPTERLTLAFRLLTGRAPKEAELRILQAGYEHQLQAFRADPAAAQKLVRAGEYPRDERLDVSELAAYTAQAGLIMNLDEAITKE